MAGKRKLFLTHASELAHRLVRALMPDAGISRFVGSYAASHDRRKLLANPERLRTLESTIGREALLVAAVEMERLLPRAFATSGKSPRPEESQLARAFHAEFFAALLRSLDWLPADAAEETAAFRRDLEIYQRWTTRPAAGLSGAVSAGQSPFADRCAILLDPAMMEQARRAAVAFEGEIVRATARTLSQLGRETLTGPAGKKRRAASRHGRKSSTKRGKR